MRNKGSHNKFPLRKPTASERDLQATEMLIALSEKYLDREIADKIGCHPKSIYNLKKVSCGNIMFNKIKKLYDKEFKWETK